MLLNSDLFLILNVISLVNSLFKTLFVLNIYSVVMILLFQNRLRLRLKCWKTPGRVLLDNEEWTDDGISSPTELFVEALDGPEEVTAHTFLVVFTRRWSPSTLTVGPYVEVALRSPSVADFKNKVFFSFHICTLFFNDCAVISCPNILFLLFPLTLELKRLFIKMAHR